MEDMKAVYRLNEEKLDFNTKVLRERNTVNRLLITKTLETGILTKHNTIQQILKGFRKSNH